MKPLSDACKAELWDALEECERETEGLRMKALAIFEKATKLKADLESLRIARARELAKAADPEPVLRTHGENG